MKKKFLPWFSLLLCLMISVLGTGGLSPAIAPTQAIPVATELRGVWLTNVGSAVMFLPWGIPRAMRQLSALQFNTVYPVVWNRGNTLYPSPTAKRVTGRSQDAVLSLFHLGQDVLGEITHLGQQHHLRVIPWFEYGFVAPAKSSLAQLHPNWLSQRQDGSTQMDIEDGDALPQHTAWLNPFHPQVQAFILNLVTEVMTHYEVIGIQVDDHFGLPVQFGYDPYTIDLYRQEHQGQPPPEDPFNPDWMQWRADKLTAFVERLHATVKSLHPLGFISLSPNSQGFAYRHYLQDWQTWVERGWVEEVILQVYRQDLQQFQGELSQSAVQTVRQQIPVAIGIYTGSPRQPTHFQQIQEQVETVRSQNFNGVSFFYWESLWGYLTPESPRQRRANFQTLFRGTV